MKKVSEKLINYIKKYNADARKYNDEKKGTGSFMGLMIEDASHWASYGVYSLRDYVKFDLQTYIWDEYKSVHGIRPRFMDFKNMGIRELRRQVNLLNK
tara:strand:+ start:102 stop:395 length:294 start_codon:yes stop_codon:yes gene_type:complete